MNEKNKNTKLVIIIIVVFFLGMIGMYGIFYFFPNTFKTIETKLEKDVTITENGIADAVKMI